MITRADIDERVREWSVREEVVEKDYVLGWLLWGIGTDDALQDKWVFKGGTCLKKCYIETYRFSEDLDFTVLPDGPVTPEAVQPLLTDVLQRIGDESGINFNRRPPMLRLRPDGESSEIRIYYIGPRNTPDVVSVKVDLNRKERVVRPTVLRKISHPHGDTLPAPAQVRCYSFEELFGEKIRAMGERCRPRDLYDIVNLYRRRDLRSHAEKVRTVLIAKCEAKEIPIPTAASIRASEFHSELETSWADMLGHQLPALPSFAEFIRELDALFGWLDGSIPPEELAALPLEGDEVVWSPPPTLWTRGGGVPLEPVRFAGVNRLCVNLGYQGSKRLIEPYSLRRTRAGAILLHAVKVGSGDSRSYRVDRIQSVEVTTTSFRPRHRIEFTLEGAFSIPQAAIGRRRILRSTSTVVYTVECYACHRHFPRTVWNTTLRRHRDGNDRDCYGRTGHVIDTRYG